MSATVIFTNRIMQCWECQWKVYLVLVEQVCPIFLSKLSVTDSLINIAAHFCTKGK